MIKKIIISLSLLICFFFVLSCNNKEVESQKKWFKGNLHTHSYWSDGDEFPEVIVDWYKSNDYQFIALSDHNIFADIEKWKTISKDSIYQMAFKNYLETYGEDWVVYNSDTAGIHVKLKTYEEYSNRHEEKDKFLVIKSEEITDGFENMPVHMNATNIQTKIEPQGGNSVLEVLQNNIDAVNNQRKETGKPMILHLNHPNFHYGVSLDDMKALRGERFFEVYNGHPTVHNLGDSLHLSTEEMWDRINISYLAQDKPLMYGMATDDSHHYHKKGSKWSNAGRGWIVVQADSLNETSLIENMEKGNFYASTGVTLREIQFENNNLSVEIEPEEGISYTISFIGAKNGESNTEILYEIDANEASFQVDEDVLFVRCKITSTKPQENPIENMKFELALTQPVLRQ